MKDTSPVQLGVSKKGLYPGSKWEKFLLTLSIPLIHMCLKPLGVWGGCGGARLHYGKKRKIREIMMCSCFFCLTRGRKNRAGGGGGDKSYQFFLRGRRRRWWEERVWGETVYAYRW